MATSLIAKPQVITPAYNPVKFIYDSTNNNESGFRYIFDVYEAGTATKIAEYRILPNLDGYGEIDLSRLLQSYVSLDFEPTNDTFYDASNCYYRYDVKVGEEYVESYDYTASLADNNGFVQISYTSQPFSVGDQVTIAQVDGGTANPNLEGLFTVTEANTNDFTVNSLFSEVTDITIDGSVKFSDNRKTVTRDIITSTNNYVFNGAIPFASFPDYDNTDYVLDDSRDLLVTSRGTESQYVTLDQDVWLNFMTGGLSGFTYFENSNGSVFQKTLTATDLITGVSCGPSNYGSLTLVSGSGSLIESDTEWYDVYYYTVSAKSASYRFYIDRRCNINDYQIAFLDRMGSINSFAFQLRDRLTGKVTKDTYNQNIEGSVVSNEWTYNTQAQGLKNINNRIEETFELNTNWMDETDASYFTELVSSPQTWIKINSEWYSCIVQTVNYEKERQRNRNLIRKTISVKLAVQDRVNG